MCGIAGWSGLAASGEDTARLGALTNALAHRGPDGEGFFFAPAAGVALGHRRLAIIDLSPASAQPMVDGDSGVALAYNGELYNFRELRVELEARGHNFRSTGDAEVILRGYLEWGEACFARFAGMFAIALWDPRSQLLWLARDALGMKPLYLWRSPAGGTVFASEARALRALPEVQLRVRRQGLAQYLEFGYSIDERLTIFAGVERLAPAEVIGLRAGSVVRRFRHFTPPRPDPADHRSGAARVEELASTLAQVVREHLIADVPVGVLLSGGLDSSLVAALAATAGPVTTVSMGFARSGHDEREWAAGLARHIGSQHHELLIEPEEVVAEVAGCAAIFDDLFADWGTVTTRILYRKCRELGLKVALVGEGADEIFAGYPVFELGAKPAGEPAIFGLYRRLTSRRWGTLYPKFRRLMRELVDDADGNFFEAIRSFEATRQLPVNYVMKVDKACMSVSLEARAPYLDRRVAEIAFRTPREWLLRAGTNKYLLRQIGVPGDLLPAITRNRPKLGGSIAVSWLDEVPSFMDFARERVCTRDGWAAELGLLPAMERYFAGRGGYPAPHSLSLLGHLAWRLLLLELWSAALGLDTGGIASD
jgi:asparagine synthase (glutamine-hydrolysing)